MSDELIIDETNFNDHFFETKTHRPKPGQVLARYTAMAELVDGDVKDFIINALRKPEKIGGEMVKQVLKHHCHATDYFSEAIMEQIYDDLHKYNLSENDVREKPYRFQIEYFYWTKPENIPENDVHWERISVVESDAAKDHKAEMERKKKLLEQIQKNQIKIDLDDYDKIELHEELKVGDIVYNMGLHSIEMIIGENMDLDQFGPLSENSDCIILRKKK